MYIKDTLKASISGNAATATKLATARTINGTSFNGSANITTANWGTARTLTIGSTGKSVNGSGNVSWSLSEIGAAASSHTHNYAGSSSAGGAANSVKTNLTIKLNGGSTEGTNLFTFNGGTAKTINITSSAIGAAASSHSHNVITIQDTRNVNTAPADVPLGLSVHLKNNGTDGLTDGGTYHPSLMMKPWDDKSGWPIGQLSVTQNNNLWFRSSNTDGTSWNGWKKVSLNGHTHSYLPLTGGTLTGDLTCNKYLKINAWSGYGSGTADLWYNGNAGNIHCSSGIRTDKALHSAWHNTFEDGFNIPTRDSDRYGVLFNTYGKGSNSYLEIARRNSANTDWDWGNSIKMYPNEVKVPSLQCYGGGSCFKLYPGNAGHTYMGFYLNGTTRGAWMGYGSNGNTQFTISADGGTGRVDIHNLNVHGIPLSIQSSAPGCGGVWIQI